MRKKKTETTDLDFDIMYAGIESKISAARKEIMYVAEKEPNLEMLVKKIEVANEEIKALLAKKEELLK